MPEQMNRIWKPVAIWLLAVMPAGSLVAQEKEQFAPAHQLGLNIGHEYSFSGIGENGERKLVILPYWGLDYNYRFSEQFSIGIHIDFITETFKVETEESDGDDAVSERTRPVAPAFMGMFRPVERLALGLGIGGEFAQEGNYWLNRLAVEYGVPIRKGWEVFGVFQYDFRWQAYDTWTLGLGISKSFAKKRM